MLQQFKELLLGELESELDKQYSAAQFRFFHSIKATKKNGNQDIIRVAIKLVDDEMNGLLTKSITFESGKLTTACRNKIQTIDPDEIENAFSEALSEIIETIKQEYESIIDEHNDKLAKLLAYANPVKTNKRKNKDSVKDLM